MHGQEGRIDRNLKRVQEYLEANFKDIAIAIKDVIVGILRDRVLPLIVGLIWSNRGAAPEVPAQETKEEPTPKEEPQESEKKEELSSVN